MSDIPQGLVCLAVAAAIGVPEVWIIRNRDRVGRWWLDRYDDQMKSAELRGGWYSRYRMRGRELYSPEKLSSAVTTYWMGSAFILGIPFAIFVGGAVAAFFGWGT